MKATPRDDDTFLNDEKGCLFLLTSSAFLVLMGPPSDIEKCEKCGGPVQIIVSIEDPDVIQKILKHLGLDQPVDTPIRSPPSVLNDHSMTLF